MTAIANKLDQKLQQWQPTTAREVERRVEEIIELADHDAMNTEHKGRKSMPIIIKKNGFILALGMIVALSNSSNVLAAIGDTGGTYDAGGSYQIQAQLAPVCLNGTFPVTIQTASGATAGALTLATDLKGALTGQMVLGGTTLSVTGKAKFKGIVGSLILTASEAGNSVSLKGIFASGKFTGSAVAKGSVASGAKSFVIDASAAAPMDFTLTYAIAFDATGRGTGTGAAIGCGMSVPLTVAGKLIDGKITLRITGGGFRFSGKGTAAGTGFNLAVKVAGGGARATFSTSATSTITVVISTPLNAGYVRSRETQVTGTVSETKNLDTVTVNGVPAIMNGTTFSAIVTLVEGWNAVVAVANFDGGKMVATGIYVISDTIRPTVVSAISIGNTNVLVQFSESVKGQGVQGIPGGNGALNFSVYSIQTVGSNTGLPTSDAVFWSDDHTAILLTTYSQASFTYKLTVAGITDLAGNPMATPTILVDPSSALFDGTDPSGTQVVDTDEDGFTDSSELIGWDVRVRHTDGSVTIRHVSSDPQLKDTDGDGVSDLDEKQAGLDPRNPDTDGDSLSDDLEWNVLYCDGTKQDTDGDGIQDGFEYFTFHTSPILADTDGDQLLDSAEVSAGNRNALISDLPSPRIRIGNVNLQLNTLFSFTDEEGKSQTENKTSESTLTRGEDQTLSTSNERSTKNTLEFSQEIAAKFSSGGSGAQVFPGVEVTATVGSKQGSEQASTFTSGQESGRSSEEAYHNSLELTTAYDTRESVTREIVDATVKVDVTIENTGSIPFTISHLELTAQTQDPLDRRRIIPVASLVPETGLESVNIGALGDPSRGPFVFKTVSVFPQQVQELMKNPRGLIVQLANFDITDELGRNFAYTSRDVLDRTAGITFDLGDGRTESYRVATASAHDRATGRPLGITMEYALSIIGLQRYATIRDGGNGIVETTATGDDKQQAPPTAHVEPGTVIVTAGTNGTINSTPPAGDDVLVPPDYETVLSTDFASIRDGGNGKADTEAAGDDVQIVAVGSHLSPGQLVLTAGTNGVLDTAPGGDDVIIPAGAPHRVLKRFRDVESKGETKQFWALFSTKTHPGVNLDNIVMRAGEQFDFTYVQDQDDDGVWAQEEYLHGSSDLKTNTDGICDTNAVPPVLCDTLTDQEEIQIGWRVTVRGSPQGYRVYSNPNQGDSDRDGLLDHEEKNCLLDSRQRDTDGDGLTDWEELNGMLVAVVGPPVQMVSRDPDTDVIVYTITPYAGSQPGLVDHIMVGRCAVSFPNGFATDPLSADTDGDLVSDKLELLLGLNPNNSADGPSYLDDDGDGLANLVEDTGILGIINGVSTRITSNKNNPDSDGDGLPDLLEYRIGSNPRAVDTDGDGLLDSAEYKKGGFVTVTVEAGIQGVLFKDLTGDVRYDTFVTECAAADVCTEPTFDGYGTNLSEKDTDFDGLDDNFEIKPRTIVVNGNNVPVTSEPLKFDTDSDGLNDGDEFDKKTNPMSADTDSDGTNDGAEGALGRNPTITDKRINITVTSAKVVKGVGEDIEPRITVRVSINGGAFNKSAEFNGTDIPDGASFGVVPTELFEGVFTANYQVSVKFEGYEDDDVSDDDFGAVTKDVFFTTLPPDPNDITVTMDEVNDGGNQVEFVVRVREITAQ